MVCMLRISCFFRGAEPCIMMLSLLIIMLILLIIIMLSLLTIMLRMLAIQLILSSLLSL